MRMLKVISLSLVGLLAMASAQAASISPAGLKADSMIEQAKKKGKAKKRAKPGKCGTFMYYNKKTKKCADARDKR
jgi:hypothetical protein